MPKDETGPTAAPGPVGDKDHPIPRADYDAAIAAGRFPPAGAWVNLEPDAKKKARPHFAAPIPKGSIALYPFTADEWARLCADTKSTQVHGYVRTAAGVKLETRPPKW